MFVLVVAKEPVPGRVKTRLCPPCTPAEAAAVAEAALVDTFAAALASGADEIVVALDGDPGPWLPPGVRIVSQGDGSFDRRLTTAWAATTGPGIQIGMDTPQVTAQGLDQAMGELSGAGSAVLGLADDGGWWAIGLPGADDRVFTDIAMSTDHTGLDQRHRLEALGYSVAMLPTMADVDHWDEAIQVARACPDGAFARTVLGVDPAAAAASIAAPDASTGGGTRHGPDRLGATS